MSLYKLHTNDGNYYVTCQPTRDQMYRYTRAKMAEGYKLSEVMFCWSSIPVGHSCEGLVKTEERKMHERQSDEVYRIVLPDADQRKLAL